MPKLEIDGRPIEVPDGTRVLQAARMLGISHSTLYEKLKKYKLAPGT